MRQAIVVIGLGEMGGVFAHGFLRMGHPVCPVIRDTPMDEVATTVTDPALVLITVGEDDLDGVLSELPLGWRAKVAMIQNELLPRDWLAHGIREPTVASVWFEKKQGTPVKVIIPTPVAGPGAGLVVDALGSIGIASTVISDGELVDALVAKNLYILTANIAGMRTGGTVMDVWREQELATAVMSEVLDIQEHLVGAPIDRDRAIAAMKHAFDADPDHGATGRSAPRRLERALRHAGDAGLNTPTLEAITSESG